MMMRSPLQLGPITRISLGLMALIVSLALVADLVTGLVPSAGQAERQTRQRVAENLAIQITSLLQAGEETMLGRTIQQVLTHDADIRAINVRRNDGSTVLRRGQGENMAPAALGRASTASHLRVPILAGQRLWGEVEVQFADAAPDTALGWLARPAVQTVLLLGVGGFALCYAYLRRAMQYIDPSAAVPDRVRKAFDVLTEGVVILDPQARIVLANRAFRQLQPDTAGELNGRHIDTLDWLSEIRPDRTGTPMPWTRTLQAAVAVDGDPMSVPRPDGPPIQLLVTSAPIFDGKGRSRGCMVTFDDVSPVHRANEELRHTLAELERSRVRIEAQNEELRTLATRDPLTSCLNRRAFYEYAEKLLALALEGRSDLCCVMVDIDHFKQFNDRYGHAVGDQVIQQVARALSEGLRSTDLLCRFGGEEFCIVMPGASLEAAMEATEFLRARIETAAHTAIHGTQVGPITVSAGVSTRVLGARSLQELLEQSDEALYVSKRTGRNRVTAFTRIAAQDEAAQEEAVAS